MYCSSCGKPIDENQKYCANCGNNIDIHTTYSEKKVYPAIKANIKPEVVLRIAAAIALLSFLFLSQASCEGMKISGLDMLRLSEDAGPIFIALVIGVIVFSLLALIQPQAIFGVLGFLVHLGLLLSAKLDKEIGEFIHVETGAIITGFCFILIALRRNILNIVNNYVSNSKNGGKEVSAKTQEEIDNEETMKRLENEKRGNALWDDYKKKSDDDLLKY